MGPYAGRLSHNCKPEVGNKSFVCRMCTNEPTFNSFVQLASHGYDKNSQIPQYYWRTSRRRWLPSLLPPRLYCKSKEHIQTNEITRIWTDNPRNIRKAGEIILSKDFVKNVASQLITSETVLCSIGIMEFQTNEITWIRSDNPWDIRKAWEVILHERIQSSGITEFNDVNESLRKAFRRLPCTV